MKSGTMRPHSTRISLEGAPVRADPEDRRGSVDEMEQQMNQIELEVTGQKSLPEKGETEDLEFELQKLEKM